MRGPRPADRRRPCRPARRAGLTLLEILAASAVLAVALAPALRVTRDALLAADRLDRRERCLTTATDRLESLMVRTSADWDAVVTGAPVFAPASVPGYPALRTSEFASDAATHGGIPGRLATVGCLAWYDGDGDGTADPDEPQALLATLVARVTAYERYANP